MNKRMKKFIALMLVTVLLVCSLASCSQKCTECYGKGYEICPWVSVKGGDHFSSNNGCSVCVAGRVECVICNGTGRIK